MRKLNTTHKGYRSHAKYRDHQKFMQAVKPETGLKLNYFPVCLFYLIPPSLRNCSSYFKQVMLSVRHLYFNTLLIRASAW